MLSESRGGRALQYVLVLVLAISLNFFLPRMMPGNPLALLAGVDVGLMTPEERAEVMAEAGLDQPLLVQYINYWGDLLRGDFGYSYRQKEPIADLILARLPYTLGLAGASLVVAAVIGVTAGAYSAWKRASTRDVGLLWGMITINSMPSFWLGMLLISLVSVKFGLLPSFGAETPASGLEGFDRLVGYWQTCYLARSDVDGFDYPGCLSHYALYHAQCAWFRLYSHSASQGSKRITGTFRPRHAQLASACGYDSGFAFGICFRRDRRYRDGIHLSGPGAFNVRGSWRS